MIVLHGLNGFPEKFLGSALAIGKFDGLHRGHALILERLCEHAQLHGMSSVAFTFDPPPIRIINPEAAPPLLTTLEQKIKLIAEFGVDCLVVYPTTREFLSWSARFFFDEIIRKQIMAKLVIEGQNFAFGHNREGTPDILDQFCRETNILFEAIPPFLWNNQEISSSAIRTALLQGELVTANEMLNRPYKITGDVVHGENRGHTLGFPTANLGDVTTLVPKPGIYAAMATVDEKKLAAAVHIGDNPTFGATPQKIEVFLLDFYGDLYGKRMDVYFLEHLRDIVAFPSAELLVEQMERDVAQTRQITESYLED